jgi:iron-sulfur cluster repair protein YtfE (RIC family)
MRLTSRKIREENYLYWPLEVLTGYIRSRQKRLIEEQLPAVTAQLNVVCEKYRTIHPEIAGLSNFFSDVTGDLRRELLTDEQLYFPYICDLVDCHHRNTQVLVPCFSSIGNVMHLSHINHQVIHRSLETIIDMTFTFNKFTQVDASHKSLVNSLNTLEDDVQSLIHIKFNILFQRASELENTVERDIHTHQTIEGNVA